MRYLKILLSIYWLSSFIVHLLSISVIYTNRWSVFPKLISTHWLIWTRSFESQLSHRISFTFADDPPPDSFISTKCIWNYLDFYTVTRSYKKFSVNFLAVLGAEPFTFKLLANIWWDVLPTVWKFFCPSSPFGMLRMMDRRILASK